MKLLKRVSILAVLITVIAVFAGCGKEATVVEHGKEMIILILSMMMEQESSR